LEFLTKYWVYQTKEIEMGGECGTCGLEEKREEKTALRRARCRWGKNTKKYKSCIKEAGL
jgi:hypothetical protein